MKPGIAAIVVTFNRLATLKECIAALRAQTLAPDEIIVVDNSCTDGTSQWLAEQTDLTHHRQANEGGAGGYFSGIKLAHSHRHQWFWCMDDDCIPQPQALAGFASSRQFADPATGFLASLVLWTDGAVHKMNAPWLRPATRLRHRFMPFDVFEETTWLREAIERRCVRVEMASFVSLLISRSAVDAVGLPLRKMFIWHDDAEFTMRISQRFANYLVFDSVVIHKTARNEGPNPLQPGKYQYSIRNMIVTLRAERSGVLLKLGKISAFCALTFKRVLFGQLKPSALYWLYRGFIFDRRPEMIAAEAGPHRVIGVSPMSSSNGEPISSPSAVNTGETPVIH